MVLYRNITIIASHLLYSSLQIEKPVSHNLLCTHLTRALVDIKLEAWGFLSVFHCIIQIWDLFSLKPLESKPKCPMTTRPPLLVVIMRNNEKLFWMFTLRMKNQKWETRVPAWVNSKINLFCMTWTPVWPTKFSPK